MILQRFSIWVWSKSAWKSRCLEKPLETAELCWKYHLNTNCFHNGPDSSLSDTGARDHAVATWEILPLLALSCSNFVTPHLLARALHNAFSVCFYSLPGIFNWFELDGSAASWTPRSSADRYFLSHSSQAMCICRDNFRSAVLSHLAEWTGFITKKFP